VLLQATESMAMTKNCILVRNSGIKLELKALIKLEIKVTMMIQVKS
jgi:hypothetical protein